VQASQVITGQPAGEPARPYDQRPAE